MNVTSAQIRAARALLGMDQRELARRAGVSVVTVRRIEAKQTADRVASATLGGVREVLEEAGAEFIQGGVRQRSARSAEDVAKMIADATEISIRSARELEGRVLLTDDDM